ncbi:hypothetical protein AMTRI_Chr11g93970 [Amborella trichopoda]
METSVDDNGAPDSWELADLDESMKRLLVACNNRSSSSSQAPENDFPASSVPVQATSMPSSSEFSDDSLNQVDQFLREALQNPRERLSILRMEQDVEKFIRDPRQQQLEFQQLPTSYLRLAAHRVAQHYGLQSMVMLDNSLPDGSGSRIVIRKTSDFRVPLIRLADIPANLPQDESNNVVKVAIKQRPQKRSQTINSGSTHSSKVNLSKTVEERKEEYNRARARIFSLSNSSNTVGKSDGESTVPDGFQQGSSVLVRMEDKPVVGESLESNHGKGVGESSSGSGRAQRSRAEKEIANTSIYKMNSRVAIFRDREVDRKDPDYDRSYDRYMQRFDPGFGYSTGGPYTIQPLYSPAINYNTEFPQLGATSHRAQIPIDHQQPHPIPPQHIRGPWGPPSQNPLGYGPPDNLIPPFNPNHVGAPSPSPVYLHSSQYACPRLPGVPFVHPHEHVQSFAQPHKQQPEAGFGVARPR